MVEVALVLTVAMLPLACWLLLKSPFNVAAICAVLTWSFGVLPALYFQMTGQSPSYSWRNYFFGGGPLTDPYEAVATLMLLSNMAAAFTVGAFVARLTKKTRPVAIAAPRRTSAAATFLMILVWAVSAVYFLRFSEWDLRQFLLPIREIERPSGYMIMIFVMMPFAIVAKSFWRHGRIDRFALLWIAIGVMAAFSRNQRRDFVTIALFLVGLTTLVRQLMHAKATPATPAEARPRRKISVTLALTALTMVTALVPVLWYSRVYFTSGSRGKAVDPTEIRSFGELLLGSPATGYPTLGLIKNYVWRTGEHIFHIPAYLASSFVPRALWPTKPVDLDTTLQSYYGLLENPSAFWFGELYYSFGWMSAVASLVFGYLLFRVSESLNCSGSLLARTVGVVLFMQSVTLFKNGPSQFLINISAMALFLLFAWFSAPRTQLRRYVSADGRAAFAGDVSSGEFGRSSPQNV